MSKRTILSISMACMLAGLLFFAGCEKVKAETEKEKAETEKDTVENSPMVAYLTGKWQWFGTSGGITGNTIEPQEGCSMQLEFSGNCITLLKNGKSIFSSKYQLQKNESIYSSGKSTWIALPGHEWPLMIENVLVSGVLMVSIDNGFPPHFTIGDNMYDGYGSHFSKCVGSN
ncbi:MAG: hypothetical protein J5792_03425 [Bacteroidales bacterium]|nr:hypothetical protein [Bacteroidales bacterium]